MKKILPHFAFFGLLLATGGLLFLYYFSHFFPRLSLKKENSNPPLMDDESSATFPRFFGRR